MPNVAEGMSKVWIEDAGDHPAAGLSPADHALLNPKDSKSKMASFLRKNR